MFNIETIRIKAFTKGQIIQNPNHYVPYNGKQDGATAEQIEHEEDHLPRGVLGGAFFRLLDDDLRHVGQDLLGRGERWGFYAR